MRPSPPEPMDGRDTVYLREVIMMLYEK
jgi:hypothetical protein